MAMRLAALVRLLAMKAGGAAGRLERAGNPFQFSARGWWDVVVATVTRSLRHRQPSQAAAAAFYALLAFAPGLAAFGSIYGLVADPDRLRARLAAFAEIAPAGALGIVEAETLRFAHGDPHRLLGAASAFGLAALLSATSSVRAVMQGLNTAYGVEETRRWWMRRLLGVSFAAGVTALAASVVALVLKSADIDPGPWAVVRLVLRWAALFAALAAALAVLYRYAPNRPRARWRWVTPGSALAAAVALATSAGVTAYLAQVATYERTYGGLGSMLGLSVWIWSVLVVVLGGAELNRALEDKTSQDTSISGRPTEPPGMPPPP